MKNSYSIHTLKAVFNIEHWSVLDNLVCISMYCDNIFIIILQESVMNLFCFLNCLQGLSFFSCFKCKDILMKMTNSIYECAFLSIGTGLYGTSYVFLSRFFHQDCFFSVRYNCSFVLLL